MFDFSGSDEKRNPAHWTSDEVVNGRLFRFLDTGVEHPLIEIVESELPRLDGYEFYEPYWVIAHKPTLFAIYDREKNLIFSPEGLEPSYSAERLVRAEGYASLAAFTAERELRGSFKDIDIWVRLGLPAKVFLPSLRRKN